MKFATDRTQMMKFTDDDDDVGYVLSFDRVSVQTDRTTTGSSSV